MEDKKKTTAMELSDGYSVAAEIYPAEAWDTFSVPAEMCVYIADKDGNPWQDICLIMENKNGKIEVLVWGDSNNEDYTRKYVIDRYSEESEDNK